MAGVLTILEESRHPMVNLPCMPPASTHRRREMIHEIHEDEEYMIWEVQKLPKDRQLVVLWWEDNYYSKDAAEALTSQAPDGARLTRRACLQHPHTLN
jgi:hypothetical protein